MDNNLKDLDVLNLESKKRSSSPRGLYRGGSGSRDKKRSSSRSKKNTTPLQKMKGNGAELKNHYDHKTTNKKGNTIFESLIDMHGDKKNFAVPKQLGDFEDHPVRIHQMHPDSPSRYAEQLSAREQFLDGEISN
jgi:hypothetical protein